MLYTQLSKQLTQIVGIKWVDWDFGQLGSAVKAVPFALAVLSQLKTIVLASIYTIKGAGL